MEHIRRLSRNRIERIRPATKISRWVLALAIAAQAVTLGANRAGAASDLTLAPGLSFNDDTSPNFPIQGSNLSEGSISSGRATIIFFGTSNCWNTAREAERLVKLYPRYRDRVSFVIVDLHNIGPDQQRLVTLYYRGYIPTIVAINSHGDVLYDQAGETSTSRGDTGNLQRLIDNTVH